jgi:hypothetical protein
MPPGYTVLNRLVQYAKSLAIQEKTGILADSTPRFLVTALECIPGTSSALLGLHKMDESSVTLQRLTETIHKPQQLCPPSPTYWS